MKRHLFALVFIISITGCTESVDSVTREYRNATNEGLDALMMVTTEQRAQAILVRVIKPLNKRFEVIDEHMDKVQGNFRTNKELVAAVFESESAHLYLSELEINRQRFALESQRLKNLLAQYSARERELLGDPNAVVNERMLFPGLSELVAGVPLLLLRKQLEKPALVEVMLRFPRFKDVKEYDTFHQKFIEKREIYKVKDIKLVE